MDFDWTTFLLEIINFLILIWILKRFLYQPVLDIIDERRTGIDQALADAKRIEEEAKALKQKNEQFLVEWENEKETAHAQLVAELAELRERKLAEITQKIDEETERRRILDERCRCDYEKMIEEKAIAQGVAFASKLLTRVATPELETHLFELLIEDLSSLNEADKRAIAEAAAAPAAQIIVQSAFPLADRHREALSDALSGLVNKKTAIEFQCDETLLAGIHMTIGPWVLHANLRDELKFFSKPLAQAEQEE
ncbi:MAG: F0F1 ATP synthase subunit delta [Burkholderiales bacterium]|nr:F0F1 ATP synthase subunit delta [Nitrosomonas sp.]MCP5276236.1 F0F1 ATP synthase subunit delta [Burkholderiales bacterium]